MQRIGKLLRQLREEKGYPLRKVAAALDIDQAILSKMELGYRKINKEQVIKLAEFFNYDEKELLKMYLSDKILYEIGEDENALEAIKLAENILEYKKVKGKSKNQIVNRIKEVLHKYPAISKAWLYGSFARNEDKPGSDIDLAVKTDGTFSYFDLAGIQHELEELTNRKVDVGFIDSFKPRILENVKQDMIKIYERQNS